MTREELEAAAKQACEFCRDGHKPKLWLGEHTHTIHKGTNVLHTLCRANDLWMRHQKGYA